MIKRIVAVTVAAGALAVPAIVFSNDGGTPNPAAQCRQGFSPAADPLGFAACVQGKAGAQPSDSSDPAMQCRQAGLNPAADPLGFAACVRKKA